MHGRHATDCFCSSCLLLSRRMWIYVDRGQAYGPIANSKFKYQHFAKSFEIQGHAGVARSSIRFLADMHSGRSAATE